MNLSNALRLKKGCQVIFTGAGGKTSAIFRLARELDPPVIVTSNTHLGAWQAGLADRHEIVHDSQNLSKIINLSSGVTLFSGGAGEDQRIRGVEEPVLRDLCELSDQLGFDLLIEADGSRQRPLKAPARHKPAIPDWMRDTNEKSKRLFIVVVGLSGLGNVLDEKTVHRPELFAELAGVQTGQIIIPEILVRVLRHAQGGVKNIPMTARKVLLLNQAESEEVIKVGMWIANRVSDIFETVLICSLTSKKDEEVKRAVKRVAGIILAGGASSRFKQPKALIDWHGKPLIRHIVEIALNGGLDEVIVVTGAVDEPIRQVLGDYPIRIVHNDRWAEGQSTSIRVGLETLSGLKAGAAIFLLVDQPFVTVDLIHALVEHHQATLSPVVAPRVAGRRANPVLFDQVTFFALRSIQGDTGGRAIFSQFPPDFIDWPDAKLLEDLDTPQDYDRLQG